MHFALPYRRDLDTAAGLEYRLLYKGAFGVGEALVLSDEYQVALAGPDALYEPHHGVGLHKEGKFVLGRHGKRVHLHRRNVSTPARNRRAKVYRLSAEAGGGFADLDGEAGYPVDLRRVDVAAGGKPPTAVHQHPDPEPERLVDSDGLDDAVSHAVPFLVGADHANIGVAGSPDLGRVQSPGKQIIHDQRVSSGVGMSR